MAWYDAGTVKVTINSATVTGTGTQWLSGARQGEAFVAPDGRLYEVLNIASNTSLTLTKPYIGATATSQKYALAPMQGYVKELADRVSALLLLSQSEWASVLKAADLQAAPNDAAKGKILVTGKSFGLGSVGAVGSYDIWPSASLNDLNVPSGIYLLPPSITDRPPEIGTQNAIVWHRQAGTAGGQMVLYPYSNVMARSRTAGSYANWRRLLAEGDFGLGAWTANPPNGRDSVNPFGWYYKGNPVPSWGGGQFFLDMPYGSTMNAGLRLSTDPYTDNFYLNGGISGKKEYRPACKLWHDKNTTVDSNGFLKKASPIIQLGNTGIQKTMHVEIAAAEFERLGTGHYVLRQVPLLSRDGWYIEIPKDRNGNVYFTLDYEESEQDQTLTIRTYEPDYSTGPAINGKAVDILPDRFVSLRFAEDLPPSPELQGFDPIEYPVA